MSEPLSGDGCGSPQCGQQTDTVQAVMIARFFAAMFSLPFYALSLPRT